jgi:cytochrome P450
MTRAAKAQEHVAGVAQRVLDIYRQHHPPEAPAPSSSSSLALAAAVQATDSSSPRMDYIIDRIVAHSYPSDTHRLGEILTFILAGHETSTNTLSFLLYELARHPDKQQKLQQELDATPDEPPLTLAQVTKMEYLNNCLRESMRLWPTASAVGRTTVKEIEYEGFVIPKGRFVQCNFYSMFRQPWLHRPDDFLPERWSETATATATVTERQQLHDLKEMFMPFALGHRNCIGQNMAMVQLRLLSANFFKFYEFSLVDEVSFEIALLMKPEQLKMRVRRRKTLTRS